MPRPSNPKSQIVNRQGVLMTDASQTLYLIPLIIVLFVVSFIVLWTLVVLLISVISGWRRLAGYYRATMPFTGQKWAWQMGWFGWARYRGVLTVGADTTGLYLELMPLFRIGHPALFIPWSDMTTEERTGFLFPVIDFQFSQVPGVTLSLMRGTAERVLAARGE
jgi:hypothetical protein